MSSACAIRSRHRLLTTQIFRAGFRFFIPASPLFLTFELVGVQPKLLEVDQIPERLRDGAAELIVPQAACQQYSNETGIAEDRGYTLDNKATRATHKAPADQQKKK